MSVSGSLSGNDVNVVDLTFEVDILLLQITNIAENAVELTDSSFEFSYLLEISLDLYIVLVSFFLCKIVRFFNSLLYCCKTSLNVSEL